MNIYLELFLFFFSFCCVALSLVACYNAHKRIDLTIEKTKDLDWSALSNLLGDVGTLKKTIQTLNNRMNGQHSPRAQVDEEIMRHMANRRVQNTKPLGG